MVALGAGGCITPKRLALLCEPMKLCSASPSGQLGWWKASQDWGLCLPNSQSVIKCGTFSSEWHLHFHVQSSQDYFFFFSPRAWYFWYLSSCPAYKNIRIYCWVVLHLPYDVKLVFTLISCARVCFGRWRRSYAPALSPRFVSSCKLMARSESPSASPMRWESSPQLGRGQRVPL